MFKKSRDLLDKWLHASRARRDLDVLLSAPPSPDQLLRKRLDWISDLVHWIRTDGSSKSDLNFETGQPQAMRAKYVLVFLERNREWKQRVAETLRSIVKDTSALDLFVNTGVSNQQGFTAELMDRLHFKLLPQAPEFSNLSSFFSQAFHHPSDFFWLREMEVSVFQQLIELFSFNEDPSENWNSFIEDAKDAILLLSIQVSGGGLSSEIRKRTSVRSFKQLPFTDLRPLAEKMIATSDADERRVLAHQLEKLVDRCLLSVAEVYDHLNEYGVSIGIVFSLDRMETQLRRMRNLTELVVLHEKNPEAVSSFIANLITQNIRSHSVRALFSHNLALISKKIVESSAETGEHYITRNRSEYLHNLEKAMGGGFITAFTCIVKILSYRLSISIFFGGLFASMNYSISFIAIQLFGFTLATKQPAMTAPALAARMNKVRDPKALEELVDETIHLMRSQFAAVLGNLYAVIPMMLIICFAWFYIFSEPLLGVEKAHYTMHSLSILGGMAPYAAFTGILLWVSSVFAGWMDNWFIYHKLTAAISQNRRMIFVFGTSGAKRTALFFRKNISAFASNISLGFFLGMVPAIGVFLGLPIDVRHVTLSTGQLSAAVVTLGFSSLSHWEFWQAVIGIVVCGFLNVTVAFSMSMFVAIRARKIQTPERKLIYRAVWTRIKKQPFSLFYPPKTIEMTPT
jgi:site-specific recombinase